MFSWLVRVIGDSTPAEQEIPLYKGLLQDRCHRGWCRSASAVALRLHLVSYKMLARSMMLTGVVLCQELWIKAQRKGMQRPVHMQLRRCTDWRSFDRASIE